MRDNNAILAAFDNEELDFARYFPLIRPNCRNKNKLKSLTTSEHPMLAFRQVKNLFGSLVKRAFSLVIDRNYIVSKITGTGELPLQVLFLWHL